MIQRYGVQLRHQKCSRCYSLSYGSKLRQHLLHRHAPFHIHHGCAWFKLYFTSSERYPLERNIYDVINID